MVDTNGNKQQEEEVAKIISIGASLDLDFTLSLTESQCAEYGIDYNSITSLENLKEHLVRKEEDKGEVLNSNLLIAKIALSSSNLLLNSLLYINRANKVKCFVEYLVPLAVKYSEELAFMQGVIRDLTEYNLLFIEEHNLLNINPNFTFTFKLMNENDTVKDLKKFIISEECQWTSDNNYQGDLFGGLCFEYKCSVFYSSIMDLLQCRLYTFNEIHTFLENLLKAYPDILLCINYYGFFDCYYEDSNNGNNQTNTTLLEAIGDILSITDISLFERKESIDYFQMMRSLKTQENLKKKKTNNQPETITNVEDYFLRESKQKTNQVKTKIGIFIDDMKTISIVQQNPLTEIILYHSKFDMNYVPENITQSDVNDYARIITENLMMIKSVFIGGFLSRLFNKKMFQTCFTAGNESVKRIIDIVRFKLDYPTDNAFYEIVVPKPKVMSKKKLELKKKEEQFILDCTNILASKKKTYNPLYDNMCDSYFNCYNNRSHLIKLGFINKKGSILRDPEIKSYVACKDKSLMNNLEKETKKLMQMKEKNELMRLQLKHLSCGLNSLERTVSVEDINSLTKVSNYDKSSKMKLPALSPNSKGYANHIKIKQDLYYKEIFNSKFYRRNNSNSMLFNHPKKNDIFLDKIQYDGFLNGMEKQIKKKAHTNTNNNSLSK